MKLKPRFVTVFTDAENFHLVKDVGQVPYFMYKTEGYDAELVSYRNETKYLYLNKEVKGLKIKFISNLGRFFYFEIGIIKYLLGNSKSIDVLNLFHFKKDNLIYLLIYKIFNPNGKSYIKLDMDILFFKDYDTFLYSNFALKNYFLKALTRWIFKLTDIFSVETNEAREYILKIYPELKKKLICIPNGVDNLYIDRKIRLKSWEEKENIIITVGRIGTIQKNTELLLDALKETELNGWKVYILGPIEEAFMAFIDQYFKHYPHLKNSVIFTGNITNRTELFEWYNRAKIFCLTSRWEGFPVTFPEALYFGNYIITSLVSSSGHVTDHGRHGQVVNGEAKEFTLAFNSSLEEGFLNAGRYEEILGFSRNNFTWPGIIRNLSEKLKS